MNALDHFVHCSSASAPVVENPRAGPAPGLGQVEMLETALVLDLVIGLHWPPEVVVLLNDRSVRPQRV